MVLLDKLLPKLQSRGSRVLIFSQARRRAGLHGMEGGWRVVGVGQPEDGRGVGVGLGGSGVGCSASTSRVLDLYAWMRTCLGTACPEVCAQYSRPPVASPRLAVDPPSPLRAPPARR